MQPLSVFDAHFRSALALLKVYQLLDCADAEGDEELLGKLRTAGDLRTDEEVVLLFNDLVVGLVREQAALPAAFFRQSNLALLLRQSVVSACTAMDVYFPALLEAHLPTVISVRQRNWQPTDQNVKDLFRDFALRGDEIAGILDAETVDERWQLLSARVIAHIRGKTLSNVQAIQTTMVLLGVQDPWQQIANRAGTTSSALREQVGNIVKRRNNIVHRGDRSPGQPDVGPDAIDYVWTNAHVNSVQSTVTACDALAREAVRNLTQSAEVA